MKRSRIHTFDRHPVPVGGSDHRAVMPHAVTML